MRAGQGANLSGYSQSTFSPMRPVNRSDPSLSSNLSSWDYQLVPTAKATEIWSRSPCSLGLIRSRSGVALRSVCGSMRGISIQDDIARRMLFRPSFSLFILGVPHFWIWGGGKGTKADMRCAEKCELALSVCGARRPEQSTEAPCRASIGGLNLGALCRLSRPALP